VVVGGDLTEDAAYEAATDTGADDIIPVTDEDGRTTAYKIMTSTERFGEVRDALQVQSSAVLSGFAPDRVHGKCVKRLTINGRASHWLLSESSRAECHTGQMAKCGSNV
jgi:hypothetical protein